jgi:hypothetical protein
LKLDPAIVPALRQGLLTLLAADAELMAGALVTRDWQPHEIAGPRERTERCWALLDAIGWDGARSAPEPDPDVDGVAVELDPAVHGVTVEEACAAIVPLLEGWLAETPGEDPRVAARAGVLAGLRELAATLARRPYR